MKKVILSLAIVTIAAISANAQTETGTWLLGGSAGFSSAKVSGASESTTTISIAPNAGYFVADNVAVGAQIAFESVNKDHSSFAAAPFVRYYFLPLGTSAKLFANGTFGFGSYKPEGQSSQSFTAWELSAGPAFFLNKSIALETAVYYGQSKAKDVPSTGTFGLKVGFQIHLNPNGDAKKK